MIITLYHGTDRAQEILRTGFSLLETRENGGNSEYGPGIYFHTKDYVESCKMYGAQLLEVEVEYHDPLEVSNWSDYPDTPSWAIDKVYKRWPQVLDDWGPERTWESSGRKFREAYISTPYPTFFWDVCRAGVDPNELAIALSECVPFDCIMVPSRGIVVVPCPQRQVRSIRQVE